jgi:hypothetical protein
MGDNLEEIFSRLGSFMKAHRLLPIGKRSYYTLLQDSCYSNLGNLVGGGHKIK